MGPIGAQAGISPPSINLLYHHHQLHRHIILTTVIDIKDFKVAHRDLLSDHIKQFLHPHATSSGIAPAPIFLLLIFLWIFKGAHNQLKGGATDLP